MNRAIMLLLAFAFPAIILGCGQSQTQETRDTVQASNTKIGRMNEITQTLSAKNVHVQSKPGYEALVIFMSIGALNKMSKSELLDVKALVVEYIGNVSAVLQNLDTHRGLIDDGGQQAAFESNQTSAKMLLKQVNKMIHEAQT